MKNRIASLFLVFALTMSLCTLAVARDNPIAVQSGGAERFTDVPASHWAYSYIDKVVGSGLFNGKTPTTFEPSNAMTRSQFVMVMARMEGMSTLEGQYTETKFPDVTPTRRAAGPIAWASADEQGFVRGFGDGTFKPDSPITRGQFAALIHRYIVAKRYTKLLVVDPEPAQFTDVGSVSPAFTEDVEYARVHGLLTGYSDGTVRASNPITRAAIAAILARFLDLVTESGYIPLMDGPVPGSDNGDSDNPPVEVPTEYKDIKLVEKNGNHGDTAIVSVTRNGVQVTDPNDLQEGDIVTIRHDPDKGYVVSIRVKDSKNKSVKPVTTKGNLSTFKMPGKNLPVTVTVTYTKEGSGGGGGGGGSSGGGGYTTSYYLSVTANVVPVEGGTVFLTQSVPTAVPATAQATATMAFTSIYQEVAGFAVFVPGDGYEFDSATSTTKTFTANDYKSVKLTKANSTDTVDATYVQISGTGNTNQSNPPAISVTGNFKVKGGGEQTEGKTWTVSASGTGAYFQLVEEKDKDTLEKTQVTSNSKSSVTVEKVVDGNNSTVYLAVSPQEGYVFGDAQLQYPDNVSVAKQSGETDKLQVYKITWNQFTDATTTTTLTMNLSQPEQTDEENLEYKVKLEIEGKGTVALKVGNETLTEAKEVTIKMTKSKYTSRYQRSDYLLPVFLTSMPLADNGYKYDGKVDYNGTSKDAKVFAANADTTADTADKLPGPYFAAEPGKTYTVTVKFDKLVSYGYNLTIIGEGSVKVDFDGLKNGTETHTNTNSMPKTYSSGLLDTKANKLQLSLADESFQKQADGKYKKGDDETGLTAEKPVVNGEEKDYKTDITLTENALTDIVVEIHKTTRTLCTFTVKVEGATDGEVTVKFESGTIYKEDGTTEADAKDKVLKSGGSTILSAYEDTVITIVPTPSDTVKVKSVTVTPDTRDVMATAGYSFQLKAGTQTDAVVTFGTLEGYSVLLQAPYGSNKSAETNSKKIQKANTLEEILYSLNDGTSDSFKKGTSGIENKFGAPTILNLFVQNYLTTDGVGKLKNGDKASGAQILEESLADAIKPNITTIVPNIVEAKKAEIKVDKEGIASKLAGYETATDIKDESDKTQILSMIPSASSDNASQLTVTVTPILTEAKAAEFGIAGQSVQKQMEGFIEDYLKAIRVKSGYEKELEPSVKVAASGKDYTAVISATVKSTSGNWPKLDPSVTMTSYLDKLNIKVAVNVAQGSTNLETKVFNSGEINGYNSTSDIKTVLESIDGDVSKAWDDTFNDMLKNGELPIDMSMVLSKELLDQVVDQMIQPPSVTLTEKVGSLGDGDMTKAAIMDIYRKFVVFDNSNPTVRLLYLKTKDDSDNTHVVATINADKNFVLDYDFEKILRDTNQSDKVPYEKLADLILAVRNGMSEDIRTNATNGQTSQSVVAALLENRIGNVKAKKWGKETTHWSEVERKEIANLLAAFLMNSETSDNMGDLWADFEASGYTFVEFKFKLDASKRPGLDGLVTAFNKAAEKKDNKDVLEIGFNVEQELK